jgi:sec-independent protein translocase protein TatA
MFHPGTPELLILLVIVILLFGVGRMGKIAGELGSGLKAFREGMGKRRKIRTILANIACMSI